MIFNGTPVFIEFSSDGRVFEVVTEVRRQIPRRDRVQGQTGQRLSCTTTYETYDVDWCDSHEHYHAHESGGASFPHMLSNCVGDDGKRVAFCYWVASHLEVGFYEGTDPAYCMRIGASQLPELFLPDPEHLKEFLFVSEIPSLAEMDDAQVAALLAYWEKHTDNVEEGEVVWCPQCKMHHDYEAGAPCEHIRWCDICGFHSVPPESPGEKSECLHRSADGMYYEEPIEEDALA
jgi:hypothetical protein